MNPFYPDIAARAASRCEYCRAPEQVFNFAFQVEHIHPRALAGSNTPDNLALACESCNLYKSDATSAPDPSTRSDTRLFHPRRDRWPDHFFFDDQTGAIHGLSAIGRATADRLRLNSGFQTRARRHWVRLGLYP